MMYAIFLLCLVGCGIHSYYLGRRVGITSCINYLEDEGYIDFSETEEDDEQIKIYLGIMEVKKIDKKG